MEFKSKQLKNSELELTISLDQKDLEAYIKKATRELNEATTIKGYRQGKAPNDLLKKSLGEDRVKENALNIAVQESLRQTIDKENWDVLDYANLNVKENTPERLVFTVSLTLSPEVQLGSYKGLKIVSKAISVSDEEISKMLKEVQESRTEYKDSDQPAKAGDRVEVDFEVTDNGKLIEGGKSENHPLVIGKQTFVPGFEEQLEGMKAGEQKQFSLIIPADYHERNIAGKELDFQVKLNKVYYAIPPVLDNVFAQSLGNFATMSQLKENIEAGLFEEKKAKESERVKLAILEEILKTTHVEVPEKILNSQLDTMVSNFDQELHGRGLELGLYLVHLKKTHEEFRQGFLPQAEKQVKINLIMKEIGKKEAIVVTDQEIDERLQEINAAINLQDHITQQGLDVEILRSRIRQSIFNEKIFKLLLEKVTVSPA